MRYRIDFPAAIDGLGLEWSPPYRGEVWHDCPMPNADHKKGGAFSINVSPEHHKYGYFNCFGCGQHGTFIELVQAVLDIDPKEARDWTTDFLKDREVDDDTFREEIERLLDPPTQEDDPLPRYDPEVIRPYRFTHPWMFQQGLTRDAIHHLQIGYDREYEGIVFPHFWKGQLVGWQTRDLTGKRKAKYKNTPDFPKATTLYHLDGQTGDEMIVVESPKTVGVLWGYGIKNVVATFGAEITSEQLAHLIYFERVYLWFDNDPAGTKATRTATQELERYTDLFVVPPVALDKGDPGDLESGQIEGYLKRAVASCLWEG